MHDLMIDVEAFGKPHTGTLLQIGAIIFDRDQSLVQFEDVAPHRTFLATLSLENLDMSMIDPRTLRWWLTKTSDAARESVFSVPGIDHNEMLSQFHTYLVKAAPTRILCSQPSYDIGHIDKLYARFGRKLPWNHRAEEGTREYGRLAEEMGIFVERVDDPLHHNALADAKAQAIRYTQIWQAIRSATTRPAP